MPESSTELQKPSRGWAARQWLRFALAATFLTRLPIPIKGDVTAEDMRASMAWYPLIGLGLGAVGWGIYAGCGRVFPAGLLPAAITVFLLEVLTGVLHLDGLMDTCDGIGSGAPRERMLEIMKDSRVGAMGVFGAIAVLALKTLALAVISPQHCMLPLLAGWMVARAIPVWDVHLFSYARAQGTGKAFTAGKSPWIVMTTTATVVLIGVLLGQWIGLVIILSAAGLSLLIQAGIARKLGGLTGDVYGMGVELAEATTVLIGAALLSP